MSKKYYLCVIQLDFFTMKRVCYALFGCVYALICASLVSCGGAKHDLGYVVVSDYITPSCGEDVSDALQQIINDNSNRTIYFPDGEYLISKPICTPAEPTLSVALQLSNYAIIRAAEGWSHDEAMIRLGGKDEANNIATPGSNYYLDGGVIDGGGVAKGVSIDSGRETVIRNTSIKNVEVGIHVKKGANNNSSDCDIVGVNIVGNNSSTSVGLLVEGYDNTFTNMRIAAVHTGVELRSQANSLRNIHPLYYGGKDGYDLTSTGFLDLAGNNWYEFCYSDEFAVGFTIAKDRRSLYNDCFAYWYSNRGQKHVGFKAEGKFNSSVRNLNLGFGTHNAAKENIVLEVGEAGGKGDLTNLFIGDESVVTSSTHKRYER